MVFKYTKKIKIHHYMILWAWNQMPKYHVSIKIINDLLKMWGYTTRGNNYYS